MTKRSWQPKRLASGWGRSTSQRNKATLKGGYVSVTQTPQQEFQERATEQASAWLTIPQLGAFQNLRQIWADANQRVRDSHALQMKTLGGEATETEMPGDINISGDHTTHIHQSVMGESIKKLIPLALAAALGSAAPLAFLWWNQKPAPVTPTPPATNQDWQLGIEVVNP